MPFNKIYRLKQPKDPEDKGQENFDAEILLFKEVKTCPFLTREEEIELVKKTRDEKNPKGAKEALAILVEHNIRFIIGEAERYHKIYYKSSFTLLDFVQNGVIGFVKGVRKFDPQRGTKLLTYVGWWIYQEIMRQLSEEGFVISHPYNWKDQKSGETALFKDLKTARSIISLDQEISESESGPLEQVIPDPRIPVIEERLEFVRQTVDQIIKETNLDERETFILEHRLLAHHPLTLEECSIILKITRERVRQIAIKAQKKLHKAALRLGIKSASTVLW